MEALEAFDRWWDSARGPEMEQLPPAEARRLQADLEAVERMTERDEGERGSA